MSKEKVLALKVYAESLKTRLARPVPPRHAHHPNEFRQVLEIDLKKTLAKIEELSK
jgi:hypothetical protein